MTNLNLDLCPLTCLEGLLFHSKNEKERFSRSFFNPFFMGMATAL